MHTPNLNPPSLQNIRPPVFWLLALTGLALLVPDLVHASTADTSAGNLPWEAPLESFRNSISGPVAFGVSIVGIVMCGAMLIWGGEINEFGRRGIMVVLVVALIVLANNVLTSLFTTAETLQPAASPLDVPPLAGAVLALMVLATVLGLRHRLRRPSSPANQPASTTPAAA